MPFSASPSIGGDAVALVLHRDGQAGVDRHAVDQQRAGAALTMVAAFLGAGQLQAITQHVEQHRVGRHVQGMNLTVDLELDTVLASCRCVIVLDTGASAAAGAACSMPSAGIQVDNVAAAIPDAPNFRKLRREGCTALLSAAGSLCFFGSVIRITRS